MSDLSIQPIQCQIDVYSIRKVLGSSTLTEADKAKFIFNNLDEIKSVLNVTLSSTEYKILLNNRPLLWGKPIKNAFTKRGDTILLAQALGIPDSRIKLYIKDVEKELTDTNEIKSTEQDKFNSVKTYVYRHGTKKQVNAFLNYDLSHTLNIKNTLNNLLSYNTGGVADYFSRPIHRMDDETFVNIFSTINRNIYAAHDKGQLTDAQALSLSEQALAELYIIQENSKLFRKSRGKKVEKA